MQLAISINQILNIVDRKYSWLSQHYLHTESTAFGASFPPMH